MLRALRAAAVAGTGAIAWVVVAASGPSCGDAFEAPCRVTERQVVVVASADRLGSLSLTEGDDGDVIALSLSGPERGADAGGADTGDAADAGGSDSGAPPPAFVAPSVSVSVVSSTGTPRLTHTFAPPSALVARRGSTESVGATFTGDAVLFHWVETTRTTSADGTTTTSAAPKLQRVGLDGSEGAVVSEPALACSHCAIRTAYAATGGTTVAIIREDPDATAQLSARPHTRLVRFDASATMSALVDIAWLGGDDAPLPRGLASVGGAGAASADPSRTSRLYARGGRFVLMVGSRSAVFDASLALVAGPWALPTPATEIDVDLDLGELDLTWTGSLSQGDAAAAANVGDQPDLLFESRRVVGPVRVAERRISTSARALLVRRNAGRAGVLHTSGGSVLFTLVGDDGRKVGGDLELPAGDPAPGGMLGQGSVSGTAAASSVARAQLLVSVDRAHFVVWTAARDVRREVVTCEP